MKIKEVIEALERFAPLPLQESWDNAGLQVGLTEAEVSGALLCLDVTCQIVDEAIKKGCNLIVSHHPLIFRKLARLTGEDYVQQAVMKALLNNIVILSMHTNMDNARGGVNYKMAEKMGLRNVRFMSPKQVDGVECGSGVMGEFEEPVAAMTSSSCSRRHSAWSVWRLTSCCAVLYVRWQCAEVRARSSLTRLWLLALTLSLQARCIITSFSDVNSRYR